MNARWGTKKKVPQGSASAALAYNSFFVSGDLFKGYRPGGEGPYKTSKGLMRPLKALYGP